MLSNLDFEEYLQENRDAHLDDIFGHVTKDLPELQTVVRMALIMSHENAHVENGFSVNETLLCKNLKKTSLIAQRVIHNTIYPLRRNSECHHQQKIASKSSKVSQCIQDRFISNREQDKSRTETEGCRG